jgi:hypothetical protein
MATTASSTYAHASAALAASFKSGYRYFPLLSQNEAEVKDTFSGSNRRGRIRTGIRNFLMREEYSRFMAPLICGSIPDLQPAFDEFASDLKPASEVKIGGTMS